MNRANFATPLSIAPFGLRTVIAGTTRWVSHEVWSESQSAWFADMRIKSSANLAKSPKLIRRKNKIIVPQYGAWLLTLTDAPQQPLAWAELHCFVGGFSHAFLIIGSDPLTLDPRPHVELLITAIGLWGHGDVIDVCSLGGGALGSIEGASTYDLVTLQENAEILEARAMFQKLPILRIDLHQWLELPKALQHKIDLRSLTMLAEAIRHKEARASKRSAPRRGILERLFSPWRT